VRDDRPFGGQDPRAAMFYHSRDRAGEYAQAHLADYAGIFQADAFGGYNRLYEADRKPGQIVEAACWVHARRPVFQMADLAATARRRAQGKTLRRSGALMRCSRSNARSTARALSGVGLSGRN
jgi:transposase